MKINGRDFRLFGKKDERPICLVLLSEKIAENVKEPGTANPGGASISNESLTGRVPEGEGRE